MNTQRLEGQWHSFLHGVFMKKLLSLLLFTMYMPHATYAMEDKKQQVEYKTQYVKRLGIWGPLGTISAHDETGKEIGFINFSNCWIYSLSVHADMQKKGIGTALFRKAIEEMSECEKVSWNAYKSAIGFYAQQGAAFDTEDSNSINLRKMSINPQKHNNNK